jgi:DNA sulfur modification protein DndD
MEILRATIRNLGPYYGKQEIELTAGERPVTLVHGENMRGKTSLLRAIRWALYGAARARGGESLPSYKLLNTDAAAEGTFEFSVEL